MRYLVLADVHANIEALEACLSDAQARGYDRTLVLGDLVGYGPDPNETIARIQSLNPTSMVRGNHDKVACGLEQPEGFNAVAKGAALWTYETLTAANRLWLASLARARSSPTVRSRFVTGRRSTRTRTSSTNSMRYAG